MGLFKTRDEDEFQKMLTKAKTGDPHAQFMTATMIFLNKGTKLSFDHFQFWLACAYLNGYPDAIEAVNTTFSPAKYPDLAKHFHNKVCPNVMRNHRSLIPYYKR